MAPELQCTVKEPDAIDSAQRHSVKTKALAVRSVAEVTENWVVLPGFRAPLVSVKKEKTHGN
jgi:hypothetical protein